MSQLLKNRPQARAIFSGVILALIAVVCTVAVLLIEKDTEGAIEQNRHAKEQELMQSLLPGIVAPAKGKVTYQCKLLSDKRIGKNMRAYLARNEDGKAIGFIATYATSRGYSNPLVLIAGTNGKNTVYKVDVQFSRETPGIGDKIERRKGNWLDQFDNKHLDEAHWEVSKFGGDFDYITGATVTTRAVVLATKDLLEVLSETNLRKLPNCPKNN